MATNIYELAVPDKGCTHEVVTPAETVYGGLRDPKLQPNYEPANEYAFKLDSFQERSIMCIENEQSVLVSAHTSAGKTVVAEYAIAKSLKNGQRVIYTTPIKALSNQKYREFEDKFTDVGLITGDVTNNPSASCLIMTTEILRQMLFRGNEIMREVGWVIFDEIHYMRDKERGVVWEETIILLPDNVHYVFLSATIPNARQFAEWISYIHHQTCHVVYTDYRPVPLEHHIFAGGLIYRVIDRDGKFHKDKYQTAMGNLRPPERDGPENKRTRYHDGKELSLSNLEKVIRAAKRKSFVPIIVFNFSKKECEVNAARLRQEIFNDDVDQAKVEMIYSEAIKVLNDEDRNLMQVKNTLAPLKNGIGVHHGGLLPIIKEITEILFGEGLIKVLFATETFAMGLNMPARTVIFSNIRKFDGTDFRTISSGEFIQMSGRAGRRGIDERGIVILMLDEKITDEVGENLLQGKPDPLNSAFHLTYNMVLNLIRVEGVNPDYILQQSFYNFQNHARLPNIEKEIDELQKQYNEIDIGSGGDMRTQLHRKQEIMKEIQKRKGELRSAKSSIQMNELKNMRRVLKRLGYCSQSDVIDIKGRVACEITSGDELLLTEMLFNGAFAELTPHQINSLLSCFVFDEKIDQCVKLTEELAQPLRMMQDLAKRIATVSKESNLDVDEQQYIEKFKPSLMDCVFAWSKGAPFAEVCKLTDAYEGSIIRCMRRLEELLRQMCQASRVIGNTELENKFSEAISYIKRDIVFAGSLYI